MLTLLVAVGREITSFQHPSTKFLAAHQAERITEFVTSVVIGVAAIRQAPSY
jgi:hypothetical protein